MGFDNILNFIFGKQKRIIKVPISPESINDNTQVKALAYENAELKGDSARKDKVIAEYKQRDVDKNEEQSVKVALNDEKTELRLKSQGQVVSLKKFYNKLLRDKKFRDRLGIYSFDRKTRIAGFGDFGFADDGGIVLLDNNGNQIMKMSNLNDMLQSVGAFGNDVARGMIPINVDSEGGYIENIMIYQASELVKKGNKLEFAKARKRPVYEIIQDLNSTIGEYQEEAEENELLIIELNNKVNKQSSELKVYGKMSETSRAELSHIENKTLGIDAAYRTIQRSVINGQNLAVINEETIAALEKELSDMMAKASREGVKLSDEKALELFQEIRSNVINELPDINQPSNEEGKK